ncbi:MAG: hypothetical protein KF773_14645 [Deltaproteobacteria bacterium]|nr:hypothetical protein [Deltaproteobacteria bacterium]
MDDLERLDELGRVVAAPTLLDEVVERRGERGEQAVDGRGGERFVALAEVAAELDQLRLRDLHDRRAVEGRAHVEPHAVGVLVVRALVLDRTQPAVQRVPERPLVVHRGQ